MSIVAHAVSRLLVNVPLCDWDHWGRHGGSPDPETQAILDVFVPTVAVILACTLFMCFVGGPVILALTQRPRHLFWSIPAVNLLVYLVALFVRPYPGGAGAQFETPGLLYTLAEGVILVLLSLGAAILLALLYAVYRLIRRVRNVWADAREHKSPAAPTTIEA